MLQISIQSHRAPALKPLTTAMPHLTNLRLLFSSANHHPIAATSAAAASRLFISPLRPKPNPKLSSSFSHFVKPKTSFSLQSNHLISTHTNNKLPLLFTLRSSYSKRTRNSSPRSRSPSSNIKQRRSSSSLSGSDRKSSNKRQKGGVAMDFEEGSDIGGSMESNVGFNRKRALGKDKNDGAKKNLQLKVRKLNPVNTICYVQILGTGMDTQDTSPSVLLFFDKQRFIFNAGEGLQRFCTEHKIKLSKIDHIFFSRVCSETAGGLPGLLLTLAGMGEEGMSVNIWGPSDLDYLVGAMRSFIPNAAMVHTHSFGPASNSKGDASPSSTNFDNPLVLVEDEVVKLSAILLRPSCLEVNHLLDSLPEQSSDAKPEIASKPGNLAVIYICELPEIKGKFDPKKAAALGLKPGPKYRELQLGNSVKSDRQDIMVHPNDVLGPSVPGPIALLVDCPTLSHLKHLLSIQSLTDYYTDTSNSSPHSSKVVNCVIHLSPSHVTSMSEYQEWMARFGGAQHILAGHEAKNIEVPILKSSARIAARLNYLCPQFFPAPGFWSLQHLKNLPLGLRSSSEGLLSKSFESFPAENLLKFQLRPYAQLGLDRSAVPDITSHKEIIDELVLEIPEIKEASQQVSQLLFGYSNPIKKTFEQVSEIVIEEPWLHENAVPSCLEDITREDMEIVLLGTGSSQPSKYRNVSSIFINLFSKGSIMFDCGEGTLGQLKRRFGDHGADDAIRGLRCIWISHIHADHHTGLARILARRRDLLKGLPHESLVVVGPRQLKRFLDAYQRLEDLDMQFLDCRHTTEDELDAFDPTLDDSASSSPINNVNGKDDDPSRLMDKKIDATLFSKGSRMQSFWKRPGSVVDSAAALPILKPFMKVLREAGLEALISFPVIHCPQAFGVVLKAADRINAAGKTIPGWKIVYSGDTRPCPELVKASHGATVLIHEATFEDGMVEEAISRNHSTTAEAIDVGDSAGAYRIILTHFSQRYPKIPVFDETHMHKTCIAFDMMSVNLADLAVLPKVLPYIKLLFRDEMIVDESDDVNVATAVA